MKLSYLFLFLFITIGLYGQNHIDGYVYDSATNVPLIGASIICGDDGTITNSDGYFKLSISNNCQPIVTYIGYESFEVTDINEGLKISLIPITQDLDVMIITGSKYEKRLSESTVSVDVIKPDLLQSINVNKGNQVLDKLPGVQVVGGQANIRGGSGFSYGAGSRVMVLVDGMPALQADAGYANWGDLPIESIDQIEVIKGAASSLYGSAAMNGIVNFRRKKATSTPYTNVFTSFTNYLDPALEISKWWDDIRYRFNVGINRVQKINKLDVNVHGFYSRLESFQKDSYEKRGRVGLNLKYHFNPRLSIGINTVFNYNDSQDFFLWDNDLRGLYKPFLGTLSTGKRIRFMIDPFVDFLDKYDNKHRLFIRYFGISNKNEFNRSNNSGSIYAEYQFQRKLENYNVILTAGIVNAITNTSAELFGDTSFTYRNSALYLQLEKALNNWSFSAGSRYEYNLQKSPETFAGITIKDGKIDDGAVVNRVGINYKLSPYSSIRSSWGQGYRFPTISERFIEATFGGFNVFPNPMLSPENGWSAEIGYKQGIKIKNFKASLDISLFTSRYFDMIEFVFLTNPLGFKPINVGDTSIPGYEVAFNTQGYIGPIQTTIIAGYTYIDPVYLNYDDRSEIRDNLSTDQNVLKYRSKHSAKIDVDLKYKWVRLGASVQHYSHMINIDKRLETPFDGVDLVKIKAFRDKYNNGYQVIDFRIGAHLDNWRFNFILGNAFNDIYTIRPGQLEAPRNITLRVDYTL